MCVGWREDRNAFLRYATTLDRWDEPGLDLDRIDNDGNYEPGNLRLVERKINSRNRRRTAFIEFQGESIRLIDFWEQNLNEWGYSSVWYHHSRGHSAEYMLDRYRTTKGL